MPLIVHLSYEIGKKAQIYLVDNGWNILYAKIIAKTCFKNEIDSKEELIALKVKNHGQLLEVWQPE